MLMFWFPWYMSNSVHYKTWLPDMHIGMRKLEGLMHAPTEDLGWGQTMPLMGAGVGMSPEKAGIDDPIKSDPDFVRFFGASTPIISPDAGLGSEPEFHLTMVNYIRRKGTGLEWRVRAWMGLSYEDGQYILDSSSDQTPPLIEKIRLAACHNAWEWNRAATLLPAVYKFAQENDLMPPMPPGGFGGPGGPGGFGGPGGPKAV